MERLLQKSSALSYVLFGLVLLSILVALYLDVIFLRNFFLALGSLLLVIVVAKPYSQNKELDHRVKFIASVDWGVVTLSTEEPKEQIILSLTVKELIAWLLLLASVFFLFLLVFHPRYYDFLSREDYIIETGTAVFLFIGCGISVFVSIMLMHLHIRPRIFIIASLALALSLFFVGMEEVSWFQRALNIDTPQAFSGNVQGELNLHNFATHLSHQAYFFGAFCLFILLPFLNLTSMLENKIFSFFLPSRFLIIAGTLFMAYDFDAYFSNPLPQLTYFITLFILVYYTWFLRPSDKTLLLPALVAYYISAPIIFLNFASQLGENAWRIGEYKELFIGVCFLLYSLEILSKTWKLTYLEKNV